ncbi:MAG: LysR family transcriptional regulator, partial [Myxococcota bacterium]
MNLDELRCFLAVVEAGSMLGASTQLGVPRGTVRRRVDELEARVGMPLLERSARGVAITEAGAIVARHGRELIEEGAALLTAVRELRREPGGRLRVYGPAGMPPSMQVAFREFLHAAAPTIRLSFQIGEEPLDGLLKDGDLAIQFGDSQRPGPWVITPLALVSVHILASPKYLQRAGRPQTIADLAQHRLASWTVPGHPEDHWPLRAGGHVEVAPVLMSNDIHMLRQQARAGIGLVLLPEPHLDLLGLPVDELVPILGDVVGCDIAVSLCLPEATAGSARVMRFVELTRGFLQR